MITIHYKCSCMKEQADLLVRERLPGEDIRKWIEYMCLMLTAEHQTKSPLCVAVELEYCKIPVDEKKPIGEKPITHKN